MVGADVVPVGTYYGTRVKVIATVAIASSSGGNLHPGTRGEAWREDDGRIMVRTEIGNWQHVPIESLAINTDW